MIDGFKCWNAKTDLEKDSYNHNGLRLSRNKHEGFVINGSLHKFFNDGLQNADDYLLSDFKNTLNKLFEEIGLNAEVTPVNGFEFGVNVKLPNNPNNALQRLILHKSNSGSNKRNYKEFEYQNYSFKIYNKSELTNMEPFQSGNILRVEIKVSKMEYLKKKFVYCTVLSDLLDVSVWEHLEIILIETMNECLFIDLSEPEINKLSNKETIMYLKYINPLFWENLHQNRRMYSRERERCESFLKMHSNSTLKTDIINLISVKCAELRDVSKANDIVKKWDKITVFQRETKIQKCDEITIKMNGYSVPKEPIEKDGLKHCKGCGRIITSPRINQSYCSAKEVGYKQAHKCRNSNSNPRNNARTSFQGLVSIPLLFDLSEFIESEKLKFLVGNPIIKKGITA